MLSNATMAVVMAALEYSRSTMLAFGNVPVGDSSIDELDAALAELQAAQAAGEWRQDAQCILPDYEAVARRMGSQEWRDD